MVSNFQDRYLLPALEIFEHPTYWKRFTAQKPRIKIACMYTPLSNNTADLRLDGRSVQHAKILEMVQNAPLYVSYP